MAPSQPRTQRSSKFSPWALTLALALVGCQPAAFNNQPNMPPATSASTAPSGPVVSSLINVPVRGLASALKTPLANAVVQAQDIATGKMLAVVASGGGNVVAAGAGNSRTLQQAGASTDASGAFNVSINGVKKSQLIRLIVKGLRNGKPVTVTRLVSPSQLAKRQLLQEGGDNVTEATTTVEQKVSRQIVEFFARNNNVGDSNAADSVLESFTNTIATQAETLLTTVEAQLANLTDTQLAAIENLLEAVNNSIEQGLNTGGAGADAAAVGQDLLDNLAETLGLQEAFEDLSQAVDQAETAAQTDLANLPDNEGPDGQNPDGQNPDGQNPDGQNPDGQNPDGQNPDVQNPDAPADDNSSNQDNEPVLPTCDNSAAAVRNDGSTVAAPTVTIAVASNAFNLTVNEAGGEDVSKVLVSIPKTAGTFTTSTNTSANLLTAGSEYSGSGATLSLVPRASQDGDNVDAQGQIGNLLEPFAGTSALFTGDLKTPEHTVATVQVFDDGTNYILAITYSSDDSLSSDGGDTTMNVVNTFFNVGASQFQAKVEIQHTNGDTAAYCKVVN